MDVGTESFLTGEVVRTVFILVVNGVVLFLFPAVGVGTGHVLGTAALVVAHDIGVALPVGTVVGGVGVESDAAPEVLGVVGVDAGDPVVVGGEGTPDGLELAHHEQVVLLEFVQQGDFDALFVVRERAVFSVVALFELVGEEEAELDLVPVVVVELFYLVVGFETLLLGGTLVGLVLAEFGRVGHFLERPPLVDEPPVVELALLDVVLPILLLTGQHFESV